MDARTIILLFSIANLTTFLFLIYHEIISGKKNILILLYALAKLFMGVAWLLMTPGNDAPVFISIVLGNTFLTWGTAIEVFTMVCVNRNKAWRFHLLYLFGIISFIVILFFARQSENIRIFIYSLINGVVFISGFVWVIKQKNTGKLQHLVLVIYLYLGIILVIRAFSGILHGPNVTFASENHIQNISFISFFLLFLSASIFFLLLKDKDDKEIAKHANALANANKLLMASNATKDKLFSIIAHDLRGPISTTSQMIELLLKPNEELDGDDKIVLLESLAKNINKTYELLENLLNWSRGQLNVISVDAKSFKINKLLEEVVGQVESISSAKKQLIENKIPDNLEAHADYEMVKVVIRNLLTNALKFSPPESKITIDGNEGKSHCSIKFIDRGVGIEKEVLNKLLSPDFLYSTPGTLNEYGTGIGLKLSKDFIEKNGGSISICSDVNKGSIFEISLPLSGA